IDKNGNGYVNIIRLTDIQDKPKLFSTFMLSLLAEIYSTMPEQGDAGRPELVIFIDEAHLIFDQASKALQDQIETIVKLIRSKGIGIYFITQNPQDIPAGVLSQLGLKIQHALRAFTANDRKAIKMTSENYPLSDYYKTDEVITQLGIGEAFVTALNEKGIPTPLVATMLRAPMSRMDVLTSQEIDSLISDSKLAKKYNEEIDRESAFEILDKKITAAEEQAAKKAEEVAKQKEADRQAKQAPTRTTSTRRSTAQNPVVKVLTSATFIRGALGILSKMFKK
ncbi:MAG: ATPase, partial [Bacteroidetes bacterium HGW-Bacteroidetes-23]